jgi:hypothetical protein
MPELVPLLATVVLVATMATLVLGVVSYVAFRARERRRPVAAGGAPAGAGKTFLVRLVLPDEEGRRT